MAKTKTKRKKEEEDPLAKDMSWVFDHKNKWMKFNDFFHLQPKNKSITLRISDGLLAQLKKMANENNTDYQKLIRQAIIEMLSRKAS